MKKQEPSVCAMTMVRDDYFFIEKWIAYYGSQVGNENLYVLVHGNSDTIRRLSTDVNFINVPARVDDTVGKIQFNRDRFRLLNNLANGLKAYFDFVIVTDADEFVVLDPKHGKTIPQYLSNFSSEVTLSAIGLDVYQRIDLHPEIIDLDKPILRQRPICKVEPLYCKPVITNKIIKRSQGNHSSDDRNLVFGEGLYLFHLKYMDKAFSLGMHKKRDRLREYGESNHQRLVSDDGSDFKHREGVVEKFDSVARIELCDDFTFLEEQKAYYQTWRRRRFFLHKAFWVALLSGALSDYSFHWRFDSRRFDRLHRVPERFLDVL